MNSDRWLEIQALFARVAELPPAQRDACLDEACGDDIELRGEVLSLLDAAEGDLARAMDTPSNQGLEAAGPAAAAEPLQAGTMLGAWRVEALIGRGGMGEVYRCVRDDGAFQMQAAAKVLGAHAAGHRQRFEQERQIVAWLDHPGIVRLIDGGIHHQRPYMVTELVPGQTLKQFVADRRPELGALLGLMVQICDAVAYAHEQGVVHRDIKPGNVIVTPAGQCKLLDFGIARLVEPDVRTQLTSTAAPLTVAYAAPEQLRGKLPSPATDVHALGVMLYELLSGRLPWSAGREADPATLIQQVLEEVPAAVSRAASHAAAPYPPALLSVGLDTVLARCLRKPAAERYPSVAELRHDLTRIAEGRAIEAPARNSSPAAAASGERRQVTVLTVLPPDEVDANAEPEQQLERAMTLRRQIAELCSSFDGSAIPGSGVEERVLFGFPEAHEDDAERAVRCAQALVAADGALRCGVSSGIVLAPAGGSARDLMLGSVQSASTRLAERAQPGEVGIGEEVRRRLGARSPSVPSAASDAAAFVGRAHELDLIGARWRQTGMGQGHALLIRAEAGVGKTRLLREFSASAQSAWRECRCGALGDGRAYAPLLDLLASELRLREPDATGGGGQADLAPALQQLGFDGAQGRALLGPLFGWPEAPGASAPAASPEQRRERTLELLTAIIFRIAADAPVALLVEDLHWADPGTLDVLRRLVAGSASRPLLLLMTARPEFDAATVGHPEILELGPLATDEAGELIARLVGAGHMSRRLRDSVIQRSSCVPLFVEELIRHLDAVGDLRDGPATGATGDPHETRDIPATLQDSLHARIDRLRLSRSLIQLCAVIGREVPRDILEQVSTIPPAELGSGIAELLEAQMLEPQGEGDTAVLRFRHALIRDAAYAMLPADARREAHARVAAVLQASRPRLVERDPAGLAVHLEAGGDLGAALDHVLAALDQAVEYAILPRISSLARWALQLVEQLPASAERDRREFAVYEMALDAQRLAEGLANRDFRRWAQRIRELLEAGVEPGLTVRFRLQLALANADLNSGELHRALTICEELERDTAALGLDVLVTTARVFQAHVRVLRGELDEAHAIASAEVEKLRDKFAGVPVIILDLMPVYARQVYAWVLFLRGDMDQAVALNKALPDWVHTDIGRSFVACYGNLVTALFGDGERLLESVADAGLVYDDTGYADMAFWLPLFRGWGLYLQGDHEAALEPLVAARAQRLGSEECCFLNVVHALIGEVQLARGDSEAARQSLQAARQATEQSGERWMLPFVMRAQARLCLQTGEDSSTLERELGRQLETAAQGQALWAQLILATALARLLAARGRNHDALHTLRPVYRKFREGLGSADVYEARSVIEQLQSTVSPGSARTAIAAIGRARRLLRVAAMAARQLGRKILLTLRGLPRSGTARQQLREQAGARRAEDIAGTFGQMKGVLMKFAQLVSFTAEGLDPHTRAALAQLQDAAPPIDTGLIHDVIEQELGRPVDSLFSEFDPQPLAAASIGQVHRAVLPDGQEVAVKVQYPGVAAAIESDLANIKALLGLLGLADRGIDAEPLAAEFRARILEELDYRGEARRQQAFHDLFHRHPFIRVPRLHSRYSSRRVLTSEFIHGQPLRVVAEGPAEDRARCAEILFRFMVTNFVNFCQFNADPHPGNYLWCDDGRLCFLDYGCVKRYSEAYCDHWGRQIVALFDGRAGEVLEAAVAMGSFQPESGVSDQLLADYLSEFFAPMLAAGEFRFTPEFHQRGARVLAWKVPRYAPIRPHFRLAPDLLFSLRVQFGVWSILTTLQAAGPFGQIYREYLDATAPVTTLGEQDREFRRAWAAERGLPADLMCVMTPDGPRPRDSQSTFMRKLAERRARMRALELEAQ